MHAMSQAGQPHRPRRLLYLADCYLPDALWPPFHRNTMTTLAGAFDEVLAIRTNVYFEDRSHVPRSPEHLHHFCQIVRNFSPEVVFSINRCGVPAEVVTAADPAHVITLFIDYFERFGPNLHRYSPGECVWLLGNRQLEESFRSTVGYRIPPDRLFVSHWCADHHAFFPTDSPRTMDAVYVGTPFGTHPFDEILDLLRNDAQNRTAFLAVHAAHKREFVYDWPAALRKNGFVIDRIPETARLWFRDRHLLQTAVCDQFTAEVRIRFLAALSGLDLHIYGTPTLQWVRNMALVNSDLLHNFQFRGVDDPAELARLYNGARIGVNLQHDNARGHGLSFRVYEIMACKAVLATHADGSAAMGEMGFVPGVDFIDFTEPAELRNKAAYLLAHEAERLAMVESAYRKLRDGHTVAHRLADMFRHFGDPELSARFRALAATDRSPPEIERRVRHIPDRPPAVEAVHQAA
jgi:hypothetical protein